MKSIDYALITNRYRRIYESICNRASTRTLSGYVERHHVIPRALGGQHEKANIVRLTAREHLIAHLCLVRCTEGRARRLMLHAAWLMAIQNNIKINSRIYERLKLDAAEAARVANTGKSYGKGIKHDWSPSAEHRATLSELNKGNTHALGNRYKRTSADNTRKSKRMQGNQQGIGNRSTTGLHWTATPEQNAANSARMTAIWKERRGRKNIGA